MSFQALRGMHLLGQVLVFSRRLIKSMNYCKVLMGLVKAVYLAKLEGDNWTYEVNFEYE